MKIKYFFVVFLKAKINLKVLNYFFEKFWKKLDILIQDLYLAM